MVLEANVARARMILVGDIELVIRSVRPFVDGRPLVEVGASHFGAVDFNRNQVFIAGNQHVVPLACWLHRILRRCNEVIESTSIMKPIRRRVVDCDFDSVKAHIFAFTRLEWKRSDEDAAIALGADLEIQRQVQ